MNSRMSVLFALLAALGCGTAGAEDTYMVIELNANGLPIEGDPSRATAGQEDVSKLIEGLSFQYDVRSAADASTGLPTGRLTTTNFRFVKRVNKASPLTLEALVENQVVDGMFRFFAFNSTAGFLEEYFQIEFSQARVASQTPWSAFDPTSNGVFEAIEISAPTVIFREVGSGIEFQFSTLNVVR